MDIESKIDLKKHVMYSTLMEKIIKEHLERRYEGDAIELMWERVQQQYADFLQDLPYLGGKKNTHNGTGGTYDCIMIFAYMEMIHGHLIRKYTCANSDKCDYRIVGDESEAAKKHPKKTDEKGYWYND